jgi:integrase
MFTTFCILLLYMFTNKFWIMLQSKKNVNLKSNVKPITLETNSDYFVLAIKSINKKGLAKLYIRYIKNRKVNYLSLDKEINPDWLTGQWLNDSTPVYFRYEVALIIKKIHDFIVNYVDTYHETPSFEQVKEFHTGKIDTVTEAFNFSETKDYTFDKVARQCILELSIKKKYEPTTLRTYEEQLNVFNMYLAFKGFNINLLHIREVNNFKLLKDFELYLFTYKRQHVQFLKENKFSTQTVFDEVLRKKFEKWYDKLDTKYAIKTSTVINVLSFVKKILNYAHQNEIVTNTDFKKIEIPNQQFNTVVAFNKEDIDYLKGLYFFSKKHLEYCRTIYLALFYSGVRMSDLFVLDVDNVLEENGDICLKGANVKNDATFFRPLCDEGGLFFKKIKEERIKQNKTTLFDKISASSLNQNLKTIFANYDRKIIYNGKSTYLRECISVHTFRKTRITWDARKDMDLAQVLSGHKTARAFKRYCADMEEKEILERYKKTMK